MKKFKRVERNESLRNVLDILSGLNDNDRVKVYDSYTGEIAEGKVINVWQWIIDINNDFENKCNFKICS